MACLEFLSSQIFWSAAGTIALIVTLVFIIIYTKATRELAQISKEELGLKKKPVINFYIKDECLFNFQTMTHNLSNVHAKYRVKITLIIKNNIRIEMSPENTYGGEKVWPLQAEMTYQGSIPIEDAILKYYENEVEMKNAPLGMIVESWAINFSEPEEKLFSDESKNPNWEWYWKNGEKWIPEASPKY